MKNEDNLMNRPMELLDIALKEDIQYHGFDYFEDIMLINNALPTYALDEIDLSTSFLGRKLKTPILFAPLTGGHEDLARINEKIAAVAKEYQLGMCVGNQIYAWKKPKLSNSYAIARKTYANGLILGNLGFENIIDPAFEYEDFKTLYDSLGADAMSIYLNPLQQLFWNKKANGIRNFLEKIQSFIEKKEIKIIIRTMGEGISNEEVHKLWDIGVYGFELIGVGGTSFSRMQTLRTMTLAEKQSREPKIGPFDFWGIPTVWSLCDIALRTENQDIPLLVGGGIRNGIQAVKALALGAKIVSIGYPILLELIEDFGHPNEKNLNTWLDRFIREMKMTMYLLGAGSISELQQIARNRLVITGKTRSWIEERNIDIHKKNK